ncbi:GNAT family N-acetyltransferase [Kriegella aquimaris]|uniref:Protein N-acetyltransferase, RimJ/RimL family n=1 Tax=Kriegella aquimaris TaxID=192904 RepID=A0A1G9RJ20_9FLAO|nr:GNAT family N-acetyltransferase [Kriegella aquimaris]SDM22887.1 Protein N-acetyltransferase, RimJ/RimL family [Kriegella aquimaris]
MHLLLENQETERLLFRKLKASDFDSWLPFHQDPRSSLYWEGLPSNPVQACKEQFERVFERYDKNLGGMNVLILKKNGAMVGLCGLLVQNVDKIQELEIGYSILPAYWQNGFASEAALKCKSYAANNQLADSLISIIHIDNIPSQKVASKIGMSQDKTTIYNTNPVHIFRTKLQFT